MPVVLDISSDEEPCLEEGHESMDFGWIKEFLGMPDDESEDSDEVVIIREVKPERKSKPSTQAVKDEDDDCLILDGDPENSVAASVDEKGTGSDELLIVGEKGQIACRDYPHPRHLCAKFPFSSTPHERHCDQCHCYVCDSLAPCLMWGAGILSADHCHANDKAEVWTIQRKNFKLGKSAPLPASTNYVTSLCVEHLQHNEILPLDITRLSPYSVNQASRSTALRTSSSLNPILENQATRPSIMHACMYSLNSSTQNQVSRPNTIPICSTTIPNGVNHGRCQEPGTTLVRDRFQPHSVPRQLLGVRNHAIQRERGTGASSLGPQFLRSGMMSKRVGRAQGTLTVNHSPHGSSGLSNHVNPAQQYEKYHAATGFSDDRNHNGLNDVSLPKNLSSYPNPSSEPTSLICVNKYVAASETQAYSQPLSQSNDSQDFYRSCIQGNGAPSSYVACLNTNQLGDKHQMGSQNEDASGNITQCGNASQDTCQQKPDEESQSETARKADFSALDSSWTENISQSIEPLIERSHLESSGSINQPPNVKESDNQFTGSTNLDSIDIENWLFDKDSVPVVTDGALPSQLPIPSPDLGPIDTGTLLFDFENP